MAFTPKIIVDYSIQGQPHVFVECQDRSGTQLTSSIKFQESIYLPYMQVFIKQEGDEDYSLLYDWWMEPSFNVTSSGRSMSIMVRLWDKMPNDSTYTKYVDAQANISIDAPVIDTVTITDCKERDGREKVAGGVYMEVSFSQGWQNLKKVDIYASETLPVDTSPPPVDASLPTNYVGTYYPNSSSQTHEIKITNLKNETDYYISLVPYDSIGRGVEFDDGYGYMCLGDNPDPDDEEACLVVPCVSFSYLDGSEYIGVANDTPLVLKTDSTAYALLESAPLDTVKAARYEMTAQTDTGITAYTVYTLISNPSGQYIGEIADETSLSISPNNLKIEFEHLVADGIISVFARAVFRNNSYPNEKDIEITTDLTKTRIVTTTSLSSLSIIPSPIIFNKYVAISSIELGTGYTDNQIEGLTGLKLAISIDGDTITTSEGAVTIKKNNMNFLRFVFSKVNTIPILRYRLPKAVLSIAGAPSMNLAAYQSKNIVPPYYFLENTSAGTSYDVNVEAITSGNILSSDTSSIVGNMILDTTPFAEIEIADGFGFNRVNITDIEFLYPESETYTLNTVINQIRVYRISSNNVETLVGEYPLNYIGREGITPYEMPIYRSYVFSGMNIDNLKAIGERLVIRFYLSGNRVSPRFYTAISSDTSTSRNVFGVSGSKNIAVMAMGTSNDQPWINSTVTLKGMRRAFAT